MARREVDSDKDESISGDEKLSIVVVFSTFYINKWAVKTFNFE